MVKKERLPFLLRGFSSLSVFMIFFPILELFIAIVNGSSGSGTLLLFPIAPVCGLIGMVRIYLTEKLSSTAQNFLGILLSVLPAAAGFFPAFSLGLPVSIFFSVICISEYFIGAAVSQKDYSNILSQKFLIAIGVVYALCAIILSILKREFHPGLQLWCLALIIAVFLFSQNQGNIDFLMDRRAHSHSHLPDKIRNYNLLLTAFLAMLLLVLVLFRGTFSAVLSWLWAGFRAVLSFLARLLKSNPSTDTALEEPSLSASELLLSGEKNTDSTLGTIILVLIFTVALLFLIRPVWRFLKEKFTELFSWLKGIFAKSHKYVRKKREEYDEYTDCEEKLSAENLPSLISNDKKDYRQWKKEVRAFYRMPDSEEKFVRGYQLSVEGLSYARIEVIPSDTTLEILKKAEVLLKTEGYEKVTDCYNTRVYAEKELPERIKELIAVLKELSR